MSRGTDDAVIPACPRCGYDLGGEVARWRTSCPLASVCPECGLDVAWSSVFGPKRAIPNWSVEHVQRGLISGTWATLLRSLRPGWFWSRIGLSGYHNTLRLVCYPLLGVVIVTVLMGLPELGAMGAMGHFTPPNPSQPWQWVLETVLSVVSAMAVPIGLLWMTMTRWNGFQIYFDWEVLLSPMFVALCPVCYLVLPTTLRRCKVRRVHVLRAFALGFPAAMLWVEVLTISHSFIAYGSMVWHRWTAGAVLAAVAPAVEAGFVWIVALMCQQWYWWYCVNRRYLRVPNPIGVTTAMIAIAGIATLIPLFAYTWVGTQLIWWLGLW